ncbi:MAG TPA: MBL fold metallo-hydrolase [Caldilineaceae bacterium]|nr:MBL fold metallo-hydrolase [Caldilineaceae bacterium]
MKVKFYAHASFRIEGDGVSVVTDPYTPGPNGSNFDPIAEPADLVIMSSATDRFHSDPSHILGNPIIINAVEVPREGITVKGVPILAYPAQESLTWDFGRDPEDNAMYTFTVEGLRLLHIGDIGNPLAEEHLAALRDQVDVMFALTGGHATIALDDLDAAIRAIRPRVVIPMHYYSPKGVLKIYPVTEFTNRYPAEMVTFVGGSELELTRDTLPASLHIYVLQESR